MDGRGRCDGQRLHRGGWAQLKYEDIYLNKATPTVHEAGMGIADWSML